LRATPGAGQIFEPIGLDTAPKQIFTPSKLKLKSAGATMAAGKGGRPRKAPALKLVEGTFRPDRDAKVNEDVPLGPMIAPNDLNDRERVHFSEIATMLETEKRQSPHHGPIVTLLSRRLAEIERLSAVIEIAGDTFESKVVKKENGGKDQVISLMIRARPEVAMRSEAMRHAQSLLSELMLSPVAALKIASGHKKEPGAFDDF
jgi:hypothetical protein